jgi:cardiolipin synthase
LFIEEHLHDLRQDNFAPRSMIHYARCVAQRVRGDMVASPGAVRSIWSLALLFFAAAFIAAVALALIWDRHVAYDFFLWTSIAILPAFALVTLHVGELRDLDGYRLSSLNLPIALTLLRVVLVPGIVLFLIERRFALAFGAFLLGSISDVADGWIARRWHQITSLGTVLDPLVDIIFNLAIIGGLAFTGLLARWVFVVAALRYGILLFGGAWLTVFVGPVRIQPTLFGRLTGIVMAALVALLVLLHLAQGALAERLVPLTQIALGVLLSASVGYAVALGWFNLRMMTGKVQDRGRVVGDVRWGAR